MVRLDYGADQALKRHEMDNRLSSETGQMSGPVGKDVCTDHNDKGSSANTPRVPWSNVCAQDSSTPLPFGDTTFIIPTPTTQDNGPATPPREEARGENCERSHAPGVSERSGSRGRHRALSIQSPSCLDHNGNEEPHMDRTDTSDMVEDEEGTSCSDLQGKLYINRVFNMNADKMVELLFSNSQFLQNFINARKITDFVMGSWERDVNGTQKRTLKYVITITNPLIGKFSTATESQTMSKDSQPGQYYVIDAEVTTHDVPYHDYFYTHNRYCIIQTSKRKCRLRVSTDVCYRKQPWGLVKSFIQKNSWSGLEDYFKHLESDLLTEEVLQNPVSAEPGQPGHRRRRRGFNRGLADLSPNRDVGTREGYADKGNNLEDKPTKQNWKLSKLVLSMSVILLILAALNLGLFFKLLDVEVVAQKVHLSSKLKIPEKLSISLDHETLEQEAKHKSPRQLQELRAVINDSIVLLEQLKNSLAAIQKSFELHNQTVMSASGI
ncbi:protein Aster-C [Hemitrygon akajei]|uniref:protein Aster-C n=1 Tax=Hemitrygon akajei TaxID=2704970 RepID=UPI003BF96BEE